MLIDAAFLKREAGVGDDVTDGAGDENLAGACALGDGGGKFQRLACRRIIESALAGMEASPHLDRVTYGRLGQR